MSNIQIGFLLTPWIYNDSPLLGSAEFYVSGTTTPQEVYVNAAGAGGAYVRNFESDGTMVVFSDSTVDLKIIIKDEEGAIIHTYDGLSVSGGSEGLDTKYSLDGSLTLTGDMPVGGFNINDAGNVTLGTNKALIVEHAGLPIQDPDDYIVMSKASGQFSVRGLSDGAVLGIYDDAVLREKLTSSFKSFSDKLIVGDTSLVSATDNLEVHGADSTLSLTDTNTTNKYVLKSTAGELRILDYNGNEKVKLSPSSIVFGDTVTSASKPLIRFQNAYGTNLLPDYTFFNDDTTGLYHSNANELGLTLGGNRSAFLNTTGLGVGDVTPLKELHVYKNASSSTFRLQNNTIYSDIVRNAGSLDITDNAVTVLSINPTLTNLDSSLVVTGTANISGATTIDGKVIINDDIDVTGQGTVAYNGSIATPGSIDAYGTNKDARLVHKKYVDEMGEDILGTDWSSRPTNLNSIKDISDSLGDATDIKSDLDDVISDVNTFNNLPSEKGEILVSLGANDWYTKTKDDTVTNTFGKYIYYNESSSDGLVNAYGTGDFVPVYIANAATGDGSGRDLFNLMALATWNTYFFDENNQYYRFNKIECVVTEDLSGDLAFIGNRVYSLSSSMNLTNQIIVSNGAKLYMHDMNLINDTAGILNIIVNHAELFISECFLGYGGSGYYMPIKIIGTNAHVTAISQYEMLIQVSMLSNSRAYIEHNADPGSSFYLTLYDHSAVDSSSIYTRISYHDAWTYLLKPSISAPSFSSNDWGDCVALNGSEIHLIQLETSVDASVDRGIVTGEILAGKNSMFHSEYQQVARGGTFSIYTTTCYVNSVVEFTNSLDDASIFGYYGGRVDSYILSSASCSMKGGGVPIAFPIFQANTYSYGGYIDRAGTVTTNLP